VSKKEEAAEKASTTTTTTTTTTKAATKKATPSVASFLSKISTPKGQAGAVSPAKGLLGDITRDDLAAVGRAGFNNPPPTQTRTVPVVAELRSGEGLAVTGNGGADNRKGERVAVVHTVDVRGVFTGTVSAADGAPKTRDLSAGGVFVETAHLLEIGDPVVLSFPLDDGKRLVVNGRVRWVTPFGRIEDPVPGMGIEFVGVDPHKLERLEAVLAGTRA